VKEAGDIASARAMLRSLRTGHARVAFVPTMGALHEGHLRLLDEARRLGEVVVLSIFVNPLQFGAGEDFERYPRDLAADRLLAESRGVDLLFTPTPEEMYPRGRAIEVVPQALAERWEGAARPGHFTGVLTVVAKLFNIVQPDVALFGQKDVQQATLVQAMVRDLDYPLRVVVVPTVREPDGLAISSRNRYLSAEERRRALVLHQALQAVRDAWEQGERNAERLAAGGRQRFEASGVEVEYLALVEAHSLEPVVEAGRGTIVAVAARVGATRLIDNLILGSA
jgi:pantoate--beta-alanine ligase